MSQELFAQIPDWAKQHGRKGLPWQQDIHPYRVWVSEVMLQQTQVVTVVPYFERFMQAFPSVASLAEADEDRVLALWSGLGYYSRARNLHTAAKQVVTEFGGVFPDSIEQLQTLPGIGRYTAGAIVSIAFQVRAPVLDGNVKRVLARFFAIEGWPGSPAVMKILWELAETTTPDTQPRAYTQGVLDLGATVCTKSTPQCHRCPLTSACQARLSDRIEFYPTAKPRRAKPVKATRFLILQSRTGRVLLEKRPPVGVWAGLWGFPECGSSVADVQQWVSERYGLTIQSSRTGELFRHTFSHFHLDIQPVYLCCDQDLPCIKEQSAADTRWMKQGDACQAGIAAPTKRLLSEMKR